MPTIAPIEMGNLGGADIALLITHFNKAGDPPDRFWTDNDTAGGSFGRGDGNVDGQDITDLITNFNGSGGGESAQGGGGPSLSAAAWDEAIKELTEEQAKGGGAMESSSGSASAVYDDSTGEIEITVDSVLCWNLISADNFTGDDLADLDEILPAGSAYNLLTRHEDAVGEASFSATMTYSALDLGAIAATGLETTDFVLEFVTGYGEPLEYGTITLAGGESASGGPVFAGLDDVAAQGAPPGGDSGDDSALATESVLVLTGLGE